MPITIFAPNRDSLADVLQIFDSQSARRAFGALDEFFRDTMIFVATEASFASREFVKYLLSPLCSSFLESPAVPLLFAPYFFYTLTRVVVAIAICGDLFNSEINAKKLSHLRCWGLWEVNGGIKGKLPFPIYQIDLPLDAVESLGLVFSVGDRNDYPTRRQCPQADPIQALEAEYAVIVGDSSVRLEGGAFSFVFLEYLYRLANSPDRHLRGQAESLSDVGVALMVDTWLAKHASRKSNKRCKRSGLVEALHCLKQLALLLLIREQAQLESKFHGLTIERFAPKVNRKKGKR